MRDFIKFIINGTAAMVVASIFLMACNGQKKATMGTTDATPDNPLTLILQDNYAPTDTAETLVVKDQKSLQKFFSKINRTRKPGIPLPQVDFEKEYVLVYCSGKQKGSGIPILSMDKETESELVIGKQMTVLPKGASETAVISPFSVYKIPATQKAIVFKPEE